MAVLTVNLSASQAAFVAAQVKNRGLSSADEFISQLILIEQLTPHRTAIDALLREGLQDSDTPLTQQDLRQIEREGMARLAEEKKNGRTSPKRQQRSKRSA
jgi:hypothetical protein